MNENNQEVDEAQEKQLVEYRIISDKIPVWFREMLFNGANLNFKEYVNGSEVTKDTLKIYKLKLPDFKFWNAPDTRYLKRTFCRSLLKMIYQEVKPSIDFEQKKVELGLSDADVKKIETSLKRNAIVAFFFVFLAISIGIVNAKLTVWLSCLGGAFLAGVFFWKHSFYLWQIRNQSFEGDNGSVKSFMSGAWFLEAFK